MFKKTEVSHLLKKCLVYLIKNDSDTFLLNLLLRQSLIGTVKFTDVTVGWLALIEYLSMCKFISVPVCLLTRSVNILPDSLSRDSGQFFKQHLIL